jgi:hypothetical protein
MAFCLTEITFKTTPEVVGFGDIWVLYENFLTIASDGQVSCG